jgi:hypothetical protein
MVKGAIFQLFQLCFLLCVLEKIWNGEPTIPKGVKWTTIDQTQSELKMAEIQAEARSKKQDARRKTQTRAHLTP